jgi:GcrA cell cycle regulator
MIAARLGGGLTRSAVLGYANRLQKKGAIKPRGPTQPSAPYRELGISRDVYRRRLKAGQLSQSAPIAKPAPAPKPAQPPVKVYRITFAELADGKCRYPLDDKPDPPFFFCGNHTIPGTSWCAHHAAKIFHWRAA